MYDGIGKYRDLATSWFNGRPEAPLMKLSASNTRRGGAATGKRQE